MKGKFTLAEIKKHLLTAISYLLPLIVAVTYNFLRTLTAE